MRSLVIPGTPEYIIHQVPGETILGIDVHSTQLNFYNSGDCDATCSTAGILHPTPHVRKVST